MNPIDYAVNSLHPTIDWQPCDMLLIMAFLYPREIITRAKYFSTTVELRGQNTRGQVVINYNSTTNFNTQFIELVNGENIKRILLLATSKNVF